MRVKAGITAVVALTSVAFGQGNLTPSGAPAPTMKTLDQVEPRTPISSVPYTISEPGSYYLTTNLTSTGHGVVITTNGVTLDLMGFTLSGDGGVNDYGIFVDGATNRLVEAVVVRNGAVKNFYTGIQAEYSLDGRFEQLALFDNTYSGVQLNGSSSGRCDGNTVVDCSISANGAYGVFLYQCNGNRVVDCSISGNNSFGVYLYGQSGGQCDGNRVAGCTISGNNNTGVNLTGNQGQCNGNTIADCSISGSNGYGVFLTGYSGLCDGNTIADCTIQKNRDRGISLVYANGNRVEGNHVTGQTGSTTYGIYCSNTTNNLIIRNSCVGQTDNFYLNSNDTYGPEVTASGALPTTGAGSHPLANFSF